MLKTLQSIHRQQEKQGAAIAPEIKVYQHRTTLYSALEKLEQLDTIKCQDAPATSPVKKTYTTTDFGKKLINKTLQAEIIQER